MDKYKIKLSPRTYRDIDDIFSYIALERLSFENVKKQTDHIWTALKKLDTFPQSHQKRIKSKYARKGYCQLLIDNYIAVFSFP